VAKSFDFSTSLSDNLYKFIIVLLITTVFALLFLSNVVGANFNAIFKILSKVKVSWVVGKKVEF